MIHSSIRQCLAIFGKSVYADFDVGVLAVVEKQYLSLAFGIEGEVRIPVECASVIAVDGSWQ